MSKCVYCHQRKGKRPCPALGGLICSQCCGEHRMARIACPSDCIYLESNSDYQLKRAGDRFVHERREFYKTLFEMGSEPAAALFNLIEVVTFGYFHHRRDAQDADVIAAVQTLRRTLSPLHIPAGLPPVFAEHLRKEYETFAKQPPQGQPLDQQTAADVLDRALAFITGISGTGLQSTRFLNGLIGYIKTYHPQIAEHLGRQAEAGGRIVLPGQSTAEGSALDPHHPAHQHQNVHPRQPR
ncbi:MAG: hypothetical protein ACREJU_18470 [Nitrospiraceae bacterium]